MPSPPTHLLQVPSPGARRGEDLGLAAPQRQGLQLQRDPHGRILLLPQPPLHHVPTDGVSVRAARLLFLLSRDCYL